MRENVIERKLRRSVEKKGGIALKLAGTSENGTPDRLVLLPGGRVAFVETKAPDGVTSPRQDYMIDRIRRLGFEVSVVRSEEELDRLLGGALKK